MMLKIIDNWKEAPVWTQKRLKKLQNHGLNT